VVGGPPRYAPKRRARVPVQGDIRITGAGNVSRFPREVVETALAHVIGDKAEQAYRRSDALDKRRKLMEAGGLLRAEGPVQIRNRKSP